MTQALIAMLLLGGDGKKTDEHLAVIVRCAAITGKIDDFRYEEFWGPGGGFQLELSGLVAKADDWKPEFYLAVGADYFPGKTEHVAGDTMEVDTLSMGTLSFGFKAIYAPAEGFLFDGRAGIGAIGYGEARGTLTSGGVSREGKIFKGHSAAAGDLAAHLGYAWPEVYLCAGFSVRYQGAPNESDDFDFDSPSASVVGAIEVELAFRF